MSQNLFMRLNCVYVVLTRCSIAYAQASLFDGQQAAKAAATKGVALATYAPITGLVSVDAVMLPASVTKHVFGREIANQYSVIEITVSNRSTDSALVVQSIFLDYTNWILSGRSSSLATNLQDPPLPGWQVKNTPTQVSSVEARIARGELLDAQIWTKRNALIRSLQLAGSLATGYQFSLKEKGIIRWIAAFNG